MLSDTNPPPARVFMSVRARRRLPSPVFVAPPEGHAGVETDSSAPESEDPMPALAAPRAAGRRTQLPPPPAALRGPRRRRRSDQTVAMATTAAESRGANVAPLALTGSTAASAAAAGGRATGTPRSGLKMTLRPRTAMGTAADAAAAGALASTSSSPSSSATRVLFPAASGNLAQQHLADEVAKIKQAKKDKWNFDFDTNRPLPGAYEWTEVTPDPPAPAAGAAATAGSTAGSTAAAVAAADRRKGAARPV